MCCAPSKIKPLTYLLHRPTSIPGAVEVTENKGGKTEVIFDCKNVTFLWRGLKFNRNHGPLFPPPGYDIYGVICILR